MNPILFAIPVFLVTIALEAWIAHRRHVAVFDLPDMVSSLQLGTLSQVVGNLLRFATLGIYVAVHENYRAAAWPMDSVLAWVLAVVMYDFFYYWFHRLNHEVGVLWAAHVVHHSSEYYNLSTALRQSSTTAALGWLFYLPMAVAGVPPAMFVAAGLINLLYQYWPHTQLIGKLGWLDRVLVTPSNHRVHHGQNDYCMDVNYGGILILWDRLFSTFAEERADEAVCYGVRKPLASFNPVWANLHVYADLWREFRLARNWRGRLHAWIAPPGGWLSGPAPHFDAAHFERYDPHPPARIRWYAVVQQGATILLVMHFLAVFKGLAAGPALAYAAVFVVALLAVGAVLDGRAWGRWLELSRLALVGGAFALSAQWFGTTMPQALRAGVALFALGSIVWLVRQREPMASQVAARP